MAHNRVGRAERADVFDVVYGVMTVMLTLCSSCHPEFIYFCCTSIHSVG